MITNSLGTYYEFGDKLKIVNDYRGELLGKVTFIEYNNSDTDLCVVRDDRGQHFSIRRKNLEYADGAGYPALASGGYVHSDQFKTIKTDEGYIPIDEAIRKAMAKSVVKQKCKNIVDKLEDYTKHYKYSYKGIKIDPYRILKLYKITDPAQQHAIKKLLRAGNSIKDLEQDIKEVILTLERMLEIMEEDKKENT